MTHHRNGDDRALPVRVDPTTLGLPARPVTDLALVQDALSHVQHQANVLAPMTTLDYLPPDHVVGFRVVLFDADGQWDGKSNGTWYRVDGGKLALHRSALDKLAQAAGISTVDSKIEVIGPYQWKCTHTVQLKGFDGQTRRIVRSKVLDLADGSPEAGKAGRGLANARAHGPQLCESKAANRAIRAALGLKGAYTPQEARRPFVFPVLTWVPDQDDPEIRRMVAAKELGLVDQLFGSGFSGAGPAYADPDQVIDADHQLTDDQVDSYEAQGAPPARGNGHGDRLPPNPSDDPRFDQGRQRRPPRDDRRAPRDVQPPPPLGPTCDDCGVEVSDAVADYSTRMFGTVLCRDHQTRPRR